MNAKVTPVPSSPELGLSFNSGSAPRELIGAREIQTPDQADFRLVIEEDAATGSYVYRTVNRRTGEVVQQFPVEAMLRLRRGDDYEAGTVIKTRA